MKPMIIRMIKITITLTTIKAMTIQLKKKRNTCARIEATNDVSLHTHCPGGVGGARRLPLNSISGWACRWAAASGWRVGGVGMGGGWVGRDGWAAGGWDRNGWWVSG